MRVLLLLLPIILFTACATGTDEDNDGVIVGGDARVDASVEDTDDEDASDGETDSGTATDAAADTRADAADARPDTAKPDTGPTSCVDEEPEPNDTPETARSLSAINDCDGNGGTYAGVLSTSSDVDAVTYDGTDTVGCATDPNAKVISGSVTVCIAAVCRSATTEFKGCPKGTVTGNECCGTDVEIDVNCSGTTSEDLKVTMTVRADGSVPACSAYSVAFHY